MFGTLEAAVPTHLDNLVCSGDERGIVDCAHNGIGVHNCDHTEDTGIICGMGDCCVATVFIIFS